MASARTTSTSTPKTAPESLAEEAREAGYAFPYLFDETQEVARRTRRRARPTSSCSTPTERSCTAGSWTTAGPSNGLPVTGADLRAAIAAVSSGEPVSDEQRASIGCGIKWRAGNEPAYA